MSDLLGLLNSMDDTPVVREAVLRSPFGYPGSKHRSLSHILPELPYYTKYIEPFGGSGSVLLARNESKLEVFNDRYSGVVCFYRAIRDHYVELTERLNTLVHAREEFVWSRDTWKNCEDLVERAARWYYMVQASFSGQGRNFGRSLKGSGQLGNKLRCNLKYFFPCHERLHKVQIENQSWQECLKDFDSDDAVFYLDPPYYKYYKGIYECEMQNSDHVELCERIFQCDGFVALSGYDNELYNKYPWDNKKTWSIQCSLIGQAFTETNNLAGHGDMMIRKPVQETLWIKESR